MQRCGSILCFWVLGLVEAGPGDFLPLRARSTDDDSETSTTTIASTTEAPPASTTTAARDTGATNEPRSLVIRGASGDGAGIVNGHYKADAKGEGGHRVWAKITDLDVFLVFMQNTSSGSSGAWYVTPTVWKDMKDKEGGWMRGECEEGSCLPTEVKTWMVTKTKDLIWTPDEGVRITSLDESFGSDWLAPTLTAFAAFMALAAASAGAGSVQKGTELCSMSGTWTDDTEHYTVSALPPAFAPPSVLSLMRLAFPVPIPDGELQLTLQQTSSPDVCMEFQQAPRERSIQKASRVRGSNALVWHSEDGAKLQRLGKDSAELTTPGLEPQLLHRVPEDSRRKKLPATWLLLACVWFRPPVSLRMVGLFIVLCPAQLAVSLVVSRCNFSGRCVLPAALQQLPQWVLRAVAAAMPLLCLLVLDYYSQTLSGSIIAVVVVSLHVLSFMGPSVLAARADLPTAAGLAGGVAAALACIVFFVVALLYLDVAWAFDRSKATIGLACVGSWMAVPMQIGEHSTALDKEPAQRVASTTTLESKSPLFESEQDDMSFVETDDNVEDGTQSEGSAEGTQSEGSAEGTQSEGSAEGTQSEGSADGSVSSCECIVEASLPRASRGKKAEDKDSIHTVSTRASLTASAATSLQNSSVTTQQSLLRMASQLSDISAASSLSATVQSPQGYVASVKSTRGKVEMPASSPMPTAPTSKEGLLLAMLNVPQTSSSTVSSGHTEDHSSLDCSTSLRRPHAQIRSPRASPQQDSLKSTAIVRSPHSARSQAHSPRSSPQQDSLKSTAIVRSPRSARSQTRSPRATPQQESLQSTAPACAAPGDRFMFVNRSGHEYDERCQEYEIVTVLKVGGNPPVKVQWQNGFKQRVRMEDLSELSSLSTAAHNRDMDCIPDMPSDGDQSFQQPRKSRSSSRRATRRIPDMHSFE